MSAINDLKIAQKIAEMELYGRQALRHFPRAEKPASAAEMRYGPQEIQNRINSWIGHAKFADTYRIRSLVLGGARFRRNGRK